MTTIKSSTPGQWATPHIATSLATAEADERQDEQPNSRAAAIACFGVVALLFSIALVVVIVRASLKG